MSADGFVSPARPDAGFNALFLRTGLSTSGPASMAGHAADGLLLVFVVGDIYSEYAHLADAGIEFTMLTETPSVGWSRTLGR